MQGVGLIVALLFAVGLMPGHSSAQVLYGSLVGTVTDQNGAVISGATVAITNKDTGQVREATTTLMASIRSSMFCLVSTI